MRRSGGSRPRSRAHRAAEPGIAARLRRPGAFVEAAEHDAVEASAGALPAGRRCARARRAFPAGAPRGRRWRRGTARRSRRARRRGRRRTGLSMSSSKARRSAVPSLPAKAAIVAFVVLAERGDHVAVAVGERRRADERRASAFPAAPARRRAGRSVRRRRRIRRRRSASADRCGASWSRLARKVASAWREPVAAGARARAAQQRALQRGDGDVVRACRGAEPQQRMLEQRQQRHRLEAAERGFRGEPREHAGRRVGERSRRRNRPPRPASARARRRRGAPARGRASPARRSCLGVSTASRNATAMASASSSALAASIMASEASALSAAAAKSLLLARACQCSVVAAGRRLPTPAARGRAARAR